MKKAWDGLITSRLHREEVEQMALNLECHVITRKSSILDAKNNARVLLLFHHGSQIVSMEISDVNGAHWNRLHRLDIRIERGLKRPKYLLRQKLQFRMRAFQSAYASS